MPGAAVGGAFVVADVVAAAVGVVGGAAAAAVGGVADAAAVPDLEFAEVVVVGFVAGGVDSPELRQLRAEYLSFPLIALAVVGIECWVAVDRFAVG